jgi:hypothetical protein
MLNIFQADQVREVDVAVHAATLTGACYGHLLNVEPREQVFIPPSVAMKFQLLPGEVLLKARVIPNHPDRRETVPWKLIYVPPTTGQKPATPTPEAAKQQEEEEAAQELLASAAQLTDDEIKDRMRKDAVNGDVWTSREMFYYLFKRDPNYKSRVDRNAVSCIGNTFRDLCREGLLVRSEIYRRSDAAYAVYFCSSLDTLTPEDFRK